MLSTETQEAERILRRARASTIWEETGEPIGETEWRRWYVGEEQTPTGWHPKTPQAILDEYGWLMDSSLPVPEGFRERQRERDRGN